METRTTIEECPNCKGTDINDFGNCDSCKITRVIRNKTASEIEDYDRKKEALKEARKRLLLAASRLNW
ncbi:hypothetical protein [Vibrio phage vB_VpaP_SJSY21]|nr:hypothetical protein [Vibrio phage vB_VpaP_SJSY21]